jgi:intracellular sulfur oxidation DsrE/DsrF family protein
MKKYLLALIVFISFFSLKAQSDKPKTGPIIDNYGTSYTIKKADLALDIEKEYKVISDVFTDNSKKGKVNPLINTVARYLNMHANQGVKSKNMKVALILHGGATKSALSDKAYQKKYNAKNPNTELIKALKKADVEIYVCGQSFLFNGFDLDDASDNVKISLSALTALVAYQSNGYQIINFN